MTNLLNVPTKLKEFFTLRTDKDNVWLSYLYSETKYVNGSVYIHALAPEYHNQKLDSVVVSHDDNSIIFFIYTTGEEFIESQFEDMEVMMGGEFKDFSYVVIENEDYNELKVTMDKEDVDDGVLRINIPPYNTREDLYEGVVVSREIINQDVIFKGTPNVYTENNKTYLGISYYVINPLVNQQFKISSYDRNKYVLDSKTVQLTSGSGNTNGVSLVLELKKSNYVYWNVELLPMCKNNKCYTGKYIEYNSF